MWMHIKLKMYPYGSHEWPLSNRTDVLASDDERSRCLLFPHRKMPRLSESEKDGENQTEQHLQYRRFYKMLLFRFKLSAFNVMILQTTTAQKLALTYLCYGCNYFLELKCERARVEP